MIISRQVLDDIGIVLSEDEYRLLEEHIETTLEERVGENILGTLTSAEAAEFMTLRDASDAQLLAWVRQAVPNFAQIVSDEVDILLGELAENSDAISSDAA